MPRLKSRLLHFACAVVATLAGSVSGAAAHDPGLSSTTIVVSAESLVATMRLHDAELAGIDPAAFPRVLSQDPSASPLVVRADGTEWKASQLVARHDGDHETTIEVTFPRPAVANVEIEVTLLASLPRGHKHHLEVRDRNGTVLATSILSTAASRIQITLDPPAAAAGAAGGPQPPVRSPT